MVIMSQPDNLETSKQKLREFIGAGKQLCLARPVSSRMPATFHWEEDAGQGSPIFKPLEDTLKAAANTLFNADELERETETRTYLDTEFARLHLKQ